MMTDRELLELAAKAAGLEIIKHSQEARDAAGYGNVGLYVRDQSGDFVGTCWNPLTDDGAALRLAVKLGLYFSAMDHSAIASHDQPRVYEQVPFDGDRYAATRRAIVQAAAEIGRTQ